MNEGKQTEVKDSLYTSLKELGLTELEINLYSVSLTLGPSPISEIAKGLQISRPNVYKIIKTLEEHDLAKFSEKGKFARTFMVEPPTLILEKIRQKKESLEKLDYDIVNHLPDLLSLYQQGGKETKIKIFQGKKDYLKVHNIILEEAKEQIEFFGSVKDYLDYFSNENIENAWMKNRIKKGIKVRALLIPSDAAQQIKEKDAEQLRETRILKTNNVFIASFQLFANKVVIWQPKTPLAILIEDEYLVAMLKSMFYALWEISMGDN